MKHFEYKNYSKSNKVLLKISIIKFQAHAHIINEYKNVTSDSKRDRSPYIILAIFCVSLYFDSMNGLHVRVLPF
jgi:hypothetical protein